MFVRNAVEDQVGTAGALEAAPLLQLVQERLPRCPHCSPFGQLLIQTVSTSGSVMEGLSNPTGALEVDSDLDSMYEFGPIHVQTADEFYTRRAAAPTSTGSHPTTAPPAPPCVIIAPTRNPGFVMLRQPRTPDCAHEHELLFSSEAFYKLMRCSVRFEQEASIGVRGTSGPSAEIERRCELGYDGNDAVPCLRAHWWPAQEFITRDRKQDWPPAKAREDIQLYGVHLVAKSPPGSPLGYYIWRISFSRAEVIASWHLTVQQRGSLLALKRCKAGLGKRGKGVKSYFMKTALFWVCQIVPASEWDSAVEGARWILHVLESAVSVRRLPCFFWADINVLQFLSAEELSAMTETIGLLRAHMDRLLMRWCAGPLSHLVEPVLRHPQEPIPEHELRVCLVRALVTSAVWDAIRKPCDSPRLAKYESFWVPRLLGSSAPGELAAMFHQELATTFLQTTLFRALLVAPDPVLSRTRVTPLPSGLLTLDPTPLVSLLQPQDVLEVLVNPLRVLDWCRQQHARPSAERPAGVPDHINSPRAFCDLALRPALLRRALCESVPGFREHLQAKLLNERMLLDRLRVFELSFHPQLGVFAERLRRKYDSSVMDRLQRALALDEDTTFMLAVQWWCELLRLLTEPVVQTEFRRRCAALPDTWSLRKYVFRN
ncbi:hypothetical protein FJT64_013493 [Amphibalanus amphitrite]|uniref:Mab-21-like HhH/H2TH-like domain-containing protein n=1 Tax=Amphibalanus amphitrite TaxID=1232801 RepID=A0A6A4V9A4_AMPAM|nr:hypothetical protein FJT64_013493 [Amphibalanus amphitrite]